MTAYCNMAVRRFFTLCFILDFANILFRSYECIVFVLQSYWFWVVNKFVLQRKEALFALQNNSFCYANKASFQISAARFLCSACA